MGENIIVIFIVISLLSNCCATITMPDLYNARSCGTLAFFLPYRLYTRCMDTPFNDPRITDYCHQVFLQQVIGQGFCDTNVATSSFCDFIYTNPSYLEFCHELLLQVPIAKKASTDEDNYQNMDHKGTKLHAYKTLPENRTKAPSTRVLYKTMTASTDQDNYQDMDHIGTKLPIVTLPENRTKAPSTRVPHKPFNGSRAQDNYQEIDQKVTQLNRTRAPATISPHTHLISRNQDKKRKQKLQAIELPDITHIQKEIQATSDMPPHKAINGSKDQDQIRNQTRYTTQVPTKPLPEKQTEVPSTRLPHSRKLNNGSTDFQRFNYSFSKDKNPTDASSTVRKVKVKSEMDSGTLVATGVTVAGIIAFIIASTCVFLCKRKIQEKQTGFENPTFEEHISNTGQAPEPIEDYGHIYDQPNIIKGENILHNAACAVPHTSQDSGGSDYVEPHYYSEIDENIVKKTNERQQEMNSGTKVSSRGKKNVDPRVPQIQDLRVKILALRSPTYDYAYGVKP